MPKNQGYTNGHQQVLFWSPYNMPKRKRESGASFGKRLAQLRKAAGFTQQELADDIGVSRRMIAYYEGETEYPPTALLPDLAHALKVSTDELLGIKPVKQTDKTNRRLLRRIQQFDQLPKRDQEALLRTIDAFLGKAS